MRVVVAGVGYGLQYILAILRSTNLELAGILSTGSERSRRLAAQFHVPLFTAVQDIPRNIVFACVAVRDGAWGSRVACRLLDHGINILLEHPVGPIELASVLRLAKSRGLVVNVNAHFSQFPAAREFISTLVGLRAEANIVHCSAVTGRRTLYSMIDFIGRAAGTPPNLSDSFKAALQTDRVVTAGGLIGGLSIALQIDRFVAQEDDGSDETVGGHFACFTPAGVLCMMGHTGPIVWTRNIVGPRIPFGLESDGALNKSEFACGVADWNAMRISANVYAMGVFRNEITSGATSVEQSPAFLMAVSSTWMKIDRLLDGI
jgi:pyochelin biosynthetic protein PchG